MTLVLSRADVERLLTPQACIAAVEEAFRRLAEGGVPPPGILGLRAEEGSFHVIAVYRNAVDAKAGQRFILSEAA